MKLSNELLKKAKECKSAEEIATLAKKNGVELSTSEAFEAFAFLNKKGEMSDDELNAIAGGKAAVSCDTSGETPKYCVGDHVNFKDYKQVRVTNKHSISHTQTGVITAVSDEKEGIICGEWKYTIICDSDGSSTCVYEHQISSKI